MKLFGAITALVLAAAIAGGGSFAAFTATSTGQVGLGTRSTFAPVAGTAPVITKSLTEFSVGTAGTWDLDPGADVDRNALAVTRSYQWQVCTTALGAGCVNVPTATGSTLPLAGLLGSFYRVVETATNAYGAAVTSSPSNVLSIS